MWRIKVIQSRREKEIPDIDVGKLLHKNQKIFCESVLVWQKETRYCFSKYKKVNSCISPYTAQVQSSASSSSRLLPIEHQKCLARQPLRPNANPKRDRRA